MALVVAVVGADPTMPTPPAKGRSGLENSPLTMVRAVEGSRVLLPCNVTPPLEGDDTILVLFYRGSIGTPIYSIDGRNGPVRESQHWKADSLGGRAYFDLTRHPPGLVFDPVTFVDQDQYVCRVDFRSSPTRNVRVNLEVVVPPRIIRLLTDDNRDASGVIGPYAEGTDVTLKCYVQGGQPRPNVTWWSDQTLLDNTSEVTTDSRGEEGVTAYLGQDRVTINTLMLRSLARSDLYRVVTCKASNSHMTSPIAATVTLDMSFPPLDVRILDNPGNPFSADERYELVCESSGSRPTAAITWWKNGLLMTDARVQVFNEGNVSRSTLYFTPSPSDNNVHISCRSENPQVPAAVQEDVLKLDVHYTPRLSLQAGQNLEMADIKEGDDVYFECNIVANPRVYKVQWFHNGEEIVQDVSAGVILSNQSLVLQQVSRKSSGQYTCAAANLHGSSGSNAVQLSVKYAPLCRGGQKVMYGAGKDEEVNITCNVEAHPEPYKYRWAFNSSSEVVDIPESRTWTLGKSMSQASYTPRSHQEYGSLLCWATNDVGPQEHPCIYHVIHASPPDPVNNCTVENVSATGASVRCAAGWDGGLSQTFTLSVSHARAHTRHHDQKAPRVLANTSTSRRPEFAVSGLVAGTEYVLTITGVNKKGQSEPVRIRIVTLRDIAEKRTSPGAGGLPLTPIIAMVLGVVVTLLLVVLVIVVVVRTRRRPSHHQEVKMVYDKASSSPASGRGQEVPTDSEEPNPDVIPVNDDHQVQNEPTTDVLQDTSCQTPPPPQPCKPPAQAPQPQHDLPRQPPAHQDYPGQDRRLLDYLKERDRSYYMDPSSLLRQNLIKALASGSGPAQYHLAGYQKSSVSSHDVDPLMHLGHPLSGTTPRTPLPTTSPPFDDTPHTRPRASPSPRRRPPPTSTKLPSLSEEAHTLHVTSPPVTSPRSTGLQGNDWAKGANTTTTTTSDDPESQRESSV